MAQVDLSRKIKVMLHTGFVIGVDRPLLHQLIVILERFAKHLANGLLLMLRERNM